MRTAKLNDMTRGWFVGNFEPNVMKTETCEVGVKIYKKGDKEQSHYHKIATEVTLILTGSVRMFDTIFHAGDIVVVEPGDITDFEAIEDSSNIVVKIPGALDDKYLVED